MYFWDKILKPLTVNFGGHHRGLKPVNFCSRSGSGSNKLLGQKFNCCFTNFYLGVLLEIMVYRKIKQIIVLCLMKQIKL